jgi:glycosyltransferase involved in cell wall biosynthesis
MTKIVIDVLIPTFNRPIALAVMLTSLISQSFQEFRVIVSDQSATDEIYTDPVLCAVYRVLEAHHIPVDIHRHLPRRGMAEQRQYLLNHARAPFILYLDDDLILENYVLEQMLSSIRHVQAGFVGSAVTGLSYAQDHRPHEQAIEFWEDTVDPEAISPGSAEWQRYRLHNAANLYHIQNDLNIAWPETRFYKVAWVGGCVMYDARKLRAVGGFSFWQDLPPDHCGEDVLAQLRVMARYGGCGLLPSGVYHQELPTTVEDRGTNAPEVLEISPA